MPQWFVKNISFYSAWILHVWDSDSYLGMWDASLWKKNLVVAVVTCICKIYSDYSKSYQAFDILSDAFVFVSLKQNLFWLSCCHIYAVTSTSENQFLRACSYLLLVCRCTVVHSCIRCMFLLASNCTQPSPHSFTCMLWLKQASFYFVADNVFFCHRGAWFVCSINHKKEGNYSSVFLIIGQLQPRKFGGSVIKINHDSTTWSCEMHILYWM